MIKRNSALIILLIFTAVSYIMIYRFISLHSANSFLIGFVASGVDMLLLRRLIAKVFMGQPGFIFIPLSIFRWLLFALILFIGLRYYEADVIFIVIGVTLPFVILVIDQIYKYIITIK